MLFLAPSAVERLPMRRSRRAEFVGTLSNALDVKAGSDSDDCVVVLCSDEFSKCRRSQYVFPGSDDERNFSDHAFGNSISP